MATKAFTLNPALVAAAAKAKATTAKALAPTPEPVAPPAPAPAAKDEAKAVQFNIRLDPELRKRLKVYAARKGLGERQLIERLAAFLPDAGEPLDKPGLEWADVE